MITHNILEFYLVFKY